MWKREVSHLQRPAQHLETAHWINDTDHKMPVLPKFSHVKPVVLPGRQANIAQRRLWILIFHASGTGKHQRR